MLRLLLLTLSAFQIPPVNHMRFLGLHVQFPAAAERRPGLVMMVVEEQEQRRRECVIPRVVVCLQQRFVTARIMTVTVRLMMVWIAAAAGCGQTVLGQQEPQEER